MGKKNLLCLAILVSMAVSSVIAQQGGFTGPGASAATVAEARRFRDDTPVILQGRIIRFLGDDKYIFADDTGNITVEIDRRVWGNLSVGENDMVEITGEIDRYPFRVEVEVRSIRRL